jgi:ADP-heptose:LPS heptosyltransferase
MTLRMPRTERRWKAGLSALLRFLLRSKPASPPEPDQVRRVLVIRQHNQLGDMLCVVPLMRALRERFPTAHVTLLAAPENAGPMFNLRYLDEVLLFEKRRFLSRWGIRPIRLFRFLRDLRARGFDLVIVPATVSASFTSDFLAYCTGAPWRAGAGTLNGKENPGGFFHTITRDLDWRGLVRHQVLRNWDVASGIVPLPGNLEHEITLTEDEVSEGKMFARRILGESSVFVVLHPGAGKPANRWPADRFARLAQYFSREASARVVFTFGPMDAGVKEQIERSLDSPPEFLVNQPIRRLASILFFARLVVSNDTGIMHLAAAAGTAVLSLFGPTDPAQWAPLGGKNRYIKAKGDTLDNLSFEEVRKVAGSMLLSQAAGESQVC